MLSGRVLVNADDLVDSGVRGLEFFIAQRHAEGRFCIFSIPVGADRNNPLRLGFDIVYDHLDSRVFKLSHDLQHIRRGRR